MSTRGVILLIVATVFAVLIALWGSPVPAPVDVWTATRALPVNHQLERSDIKGPDGRYRLSRIADPATMVGRHLILAKRAGDTLSATDLSQTTRFTPGPARSRVAIHRLKGEDYLSLAIPQGAWVVPCYVRPGAEKPDPMKTTCSADSLLVEAVHRAVAPADDNWIALRIPFCHSGIIGEYLARENHFLMLAPVTDASPAVRTATAAPGACP